MKTLLGFGEKPRDRANFTHICSYPESPEHLVNYTLWAHGLVWQFSQKKSLFIIPLVSNGNGATLPVGHKSEYKAKHSEKNHHEHAAYVFGCVRQLLFDSLHNLPEGGSVQGVSVPAGPHNLIPAQQGKKTKTTFQQQTLDDSTFNIKFQACVTQNKRNRMLWLRRHLSSNTVPPLILLHTLMFHLSNSYPQHTRFHMQLTFHWVRTREHPFCILL